MTQVDPHFSTKSGIFISYRRDDDTGYIYALHRDLVERFGNGRIFMDIDSIEPGLDFVEVIENAITSCSVVLVVIGKRWQPQRLQDSRDFVRLELQIAFEKGLRIIPIVLENAEMPRAEDLPSELAPLARRQAHKMSYRHFRAETDTLLELLGKLLADRTPCWRLSESAGIWLWGRVFG